VHIDPTALQRTVDALDGTAIEAQPVEAVLAEATAAISALVGATGTGLMLADDEAVLRYVAATDDAAKVLEEVQERLGRGPCIDCVVENQLIVTDDLATDDRWPDVAAEVAHRGVRSLVGAPVFLGGSPVGSLNIYDREVRAWDDSDCNAIETLARSFSALLDNALHRRRGDELVRQLQRALDSRVVIERAVGYLMASLGVDAVEAFNHLRRDARSRREKVVQRAARLLDERPPPPLPG
jgi:GAF domain-containing protein